MAKQARANELIAEGDGYTFIADPRSPDLRHTSKRRRHLCHCVCVCTVVTSNIPLNFVIPGGKFGLPNSGIGLFCADTGTLTEILGFLSDWFKTVFMVDSENVRVEFPPEIRIVAFLLAHAIFRPNAHLPPTAPAGMNHAPPPENYIISNKSSKPESLQIAFAKFRIRGDFLGQVKDESPKIQYLTQANLGR